MAHDAYIQSLKGMPHILVACRSEFVTEFGCPTLAASLFLPLGWEALPWYVISATGH